MGYGTRYVLKADYYPGNSPEEAIATLTEESSEAAYAITDSGETNNSDAKWYEHEGELLKLSKEYPHLIFTLNGWGEEKEDIWVKYFQDGRVQREKATLMLGEFDPSKLK